MSTMMQPQIILLKEGTDTSQGKAQLVSNVMAVANVVRTTLGPRGMDKLIRDDKGNTTISNDGATIMKLLDLVLPPAKILDIANSQDSESKWHLEELQGQVKSLKDEKLLMLEKVYELETQVDALNAAAISIKSSMLAKEKARYDEGYDEGIRDYMRSAWEKVPDLDWSLFGEDTMTMIEDFKSEVVVKHDSVPPALAIERPSGSIPEAVEVPSSEVIQPALPAPVVLEESDKVPSV